MILKAERTLLVPWEEKYAKRLYELAKDERVGPVAGWPVHRDVENSREVIRNILSKEGTFAVVLRGGDIIGSAGIVFGEDSSLNLPMWQGEIGYWLGYDYWGQGLMTEIVRELIRFGFEDIGLNTIWCGYFEGNERSRRVQEKCGFTYHHTINDMYWALLDDYRTEHVMCVTKEEFETDEAHY